MCCAGVQNRLLPLSLHPGVCLARSVLHNGPVCVIVCYYTTTTTIPSATRRREQNATAKRRDRVVVKNTAQAIEGREGERGRAIEREREGEKKKREKEK